MLDQLLADVRHGWRAIVRTPIFATVVVASLGIGIGVNTVAFSWLQAIVFRPMPGVEDASSFYLIEARAETGSFPGASWLEYRDLQPRVRSIPKLLAFRMVPFNVGEASRNERTYGLLVSGNYFSALDLRPAAGRFIEAEDRGTSRADTSDDPVVIISYDYWQTRFDGSASAIGRVVRVNDRDLTVIGVTPEGFQGTVLGLQFDLWVPATLAPMLFNGSRELADRGLRGYQVMGRLSPDATLAQAQAEVQRAMAELAQLYPATNSSTQGNVVVFWRAGRGPQGFLFQAIAILQGVMLVLLLAVCGNTANLVLARASARQREIGVRLAVGAGAWRVIRLLLVENLVLGLLGAGVGTLVAMWGTNALRAVPLLTMAFPVRFQTSVDAMGLTFAIVLGVVCALIFGAVPAMQLARLDLQQALRSGGGVVGRRGMRNVLMAAEAGLALVVLIVAGLFFQSFRETREVDPGFRREGLLLTAYDLSGRGVTGEGGRDYARRLLERLRAIPEVEFAAIATQVPLDIHGLPLQAFALEGRAQVNGALDRALRNTVTPDYFKVMGIALVKGSHFASLDDTSLPPQAIVNEEFVRRYVAGAEPLGRRLQAGSRTYTITGVVRNSLYESFSESPTPIIYFSYRDRPSIQGEIHLSTRAGSETMLATSVARAVREVDQSLPVYNVRSMTQHLETSLALRRIPARMFIVLGPLILALAAVGIYAVVAYTVSYRTTEIGVRLALGATAGGVVLQIVRESLRFVLAGSVVGWLLVLFVYTRLPWVNTIDRLAFFGVPAVLLVVATLACWIPARRASRITPMMALRSE